MDLLGGPRRRKLLAPEVIQTSGLDCGPGTLKCVLDGFGMNVSYGRLREICQTDVDGTSIDTIEEVAEQLGLEAQQLVLPADYLLSRTGNPLPAVAVKRLPNGIFHFVVLWRSVGGFVQVMDPEIGRYWIQGRSLRRDLLIHDQPVAADLWRELAATDVFLKPLAARLRELGLHRGGDAHVQRAIDDRGWRSLAILDAAARMTALLVDAGGVRRGPAAERLLSSTIERAQEEAIPSRAIPARCWSAWAPGAARDAKQLSMIGAVLVRFERGESGRRAPSRVGPISPELVRKVTEELPSPWIQLLRLLRREDLLSLAAVVPTLAVVSGALLIEALLLRGMFDLARELGLARQRLAAAAVFLLLVLIVLLYEVAVAVHIHRMGRHLEIRLRLALMQKLPRLGDRYFRSRLVSDLAERSHGIQQVRFLPSAGQRLMHAIFDLVATSAAIGLLDPRSLPVVIAAMVGTIGLPLVLRSHLAERDLRVRSHLGAMSRHYLDSLLGLLPIRTHGAESAVQREHEGILVEWARAARALLRSILSLELAELVLGLGAAVWLVASYVARVSEPLGVLLLLYWALRLPALAKQIVSVVAQLPMFYNTTVRLLEPLGAPEEEAAPDAPPPVVAKSENKRGVRVRLEGVTVIECGREIVTDIKIDIEPSRHVAIIGPSGAGKSTLVGVLLGWSKPARGRVQIDGVELSPEIVRRLRRRTAWVDPAVHLWNESLLGNIRYGCHEPDAPLPRALDESDVLALLDKLPQGMDTRLGEGGALVSGGEGQRVRLARAMLRDGIELAVLDEAFRGLDRERRAEMLRRARRLWAGATLLCITHDIGATLGFDRVIVMNGGRVVEDGEPAALAAQTGSTYRQMLDAEERVHAELWSGAAWRRLRIIGGDLTEETAETAR